MPDFFIAVDIEFKLNMSLNSLLVTCYTDDKNDYAGTVFIKGERGCCQLELEKDFSEVAYGYFLMLRNDDRSLSKTL